jgi:signal transduction histidine kinase
VRAEAPEVVVTLDAALLRRAVDELVSNAVRHGPNVMLRATVAGGCLTVEVTDEGPGVPDALRETLFEPFVTGRPDGTGLGLAIAREMVEAMGGRLTLASAVPAMFRVEVPCG